MEYAFEGADLAEGSAPRPSVFAHAVVEGLTTGEADLDADGEVSLDDLYDYVFDHVRGRNPNQTPGRTVDMQGDMYLAHSRRQRIVPRPLPQALRRAVEDPDFYTASAHWRNCAPGCRTRISPSRWGRARPWRRWRRTTSGSSRTRRGAPSPSRNCGPTRAAWTSAGCR